jgi:hypothetical protein
MVLLFYMILWESYKSKSIEFAQLLVLLEIIGFLIGRQKLFFILVNNIMKYKNYGKIL